MFNNSNNITIVSTIQGGVAKDNRGSIRFVNDFDLQFVRRFYIIKNTDTLLTRGWRGHKIERRWFYALSGAFVIDLIVIDNWKTPSVDLPIHRIELNAKEMKVLEVPAGYATAFRALESDSELLVFADNVIANAPMDDHTWPLNYFNRFSV